MVFAVKNRNALISPNWEERLYQYITGTIRGKGQKLLAINGMPDHLHILIGMKPTCCISDLVREIKKSSSDFIKDNNLSPYQFNWQNGFGAFSYSHSHLDNIIFYIMNQKEHHKKREFKEEYLEFLSKYDVDYKKEYLFDWIE